MTYQIKNTYKMHSPYSFSFQPHSPLFLFFLPSTPVTNPLFRTLGQCPPYTMVAFSSLPFPPSFLNPNPNPNPYPTFYHLHTPKPPSFSPRYRRRHFHLSSKPFTPLPLPNPNPEPESESELEPELEKPSFAVATGELFISIASRLIGAFRPSPEELGSVQGDEERIAVVVEDDVEVEGEGETVVLWEQRVKDVEAERRRETVTSPGFSFSAAGLLFPYHLGVAHFLIQNGYLKESTPLAGSSAGAIVCAVIASGTSMHDALEATKVLADDCRLSGTAFRLGGVLRGVLDQVLPDDIHIRCNGRIRVAVTQIVWRPRGLLVDQFDSKEDVINALITSSFIPGYLAPRPATMFRNKLCVDGGLTIFMPPTSASQTVRVCAFPASSLRMQGIGISPDCNPDTKLTTRQLLNWALEPAEDSTLDKLFELGYSDAAVWATENPVNSIVQEDIVSMENPDNSVVEENVLAKESPVNSVVEEDISAVEKPLNLVVQEDTI